LSDAPFKDVERATDAAVMTKVEKRRSRRRPLAVLLCVFLLVGGLLYLATTPPPGASVREPSGRLPNGLGADVANGVDPTLSRAASILAGRRTPVRCWSQAYWTRAPWQANTSLSEINLSPEICAELKRLVRGGAPVRRDAAPDAPSWSVGALAHEAQHASGIHDEALAACYGLQTTAQAALLLGRSRAEGRYLAKVYWERWYPWFKPPYSSRDCRNGGALDLRPDSDVWP
jgi:hypothetical protein